MKFSPYLQHTRPQSFPVTFFSALTGYALSPSKEGTIPGILLDMALLSGIFSVLLWGGTNAFNSGQDGDSGPLTLLPDPPPVPPLLSAFGLCLMGAAVIASAFVSARLMAWTSVGMALSIFYSLKNGYFTRGKDIPFLDMLINSLGFGLCALLFGYLLTESPVTPPVLLAGVGFSFAYLGGMPTSQIFQLKGAGNPERNYTSLLGPSLVLRLGAVFFVLHLAFLMWSYTDTDLLGANLAALLCWAGWAALVLVAAAHSWWWSKAPYVNADNRMNRQMLMMTGSQLLWTAYAWIIH